METLGEVMALLARDDVGPVEVDRGELASCLLPTVLHSATAMLRERSERSDTLEFVDDPLLVSVVLSFTY